MVQPWKIVQIPNHPKNFQTGPKRYDSTLNRTFQPGSRLVRVLCEGGTNNLRGSQFHKNRYRYNIVPYRTILTSTRHGSRTSSMNITFKYNLNKNISSPSPGLQSQQKYFKSNPSRPGLGSSFAKSYRLKEDYIC